MVVLAGVQRATYARWSRRRFTAAVLVSLLTLNTLLGVAHTARGKAIYAVLPFRGAADYAVCCAVYVLLFFMLFNILFMLLMQ